MSEQNLSQTLIVWIGQGGKVRRDANDPLAGLCGAPVARNVSQGGGSHCQRGAGEGTDHKRIGRCWQHDDVEPSEGLAPWVGEVDDESWRRMTGGRINPGELSHGISEVERARKSFEDMACAALPTEDDQEVFRSIAVDPVSLIDIRIKFNCVMAVRVWKFIKRRTQAIDLMERGAGAKATRDPEIRDAENTLIRLSGAFCRLMEVRVRYSELAEEQSRDDFFAEFLAEMPADDFRRAAMEPQVLQKFISRERGRNVGSAQ